ncbi:MAG TPA: membrane protein insertase YidC, partial [Campylobacteraceae bacterium]|nr:membrane protein insertase YidC [Campylobacteraceae bacterium]
MNLFDKMTQQQRMLLAIVLSFIFFIVYDFLLPKPQALPADMNQTAISQNSAASATTSAPAPATASTAAPAGASQGAPASDAASVSAAGADAHENIAEVNTRDFHMYIDDLGRVSRFEVLIEKFKTEEGKLPNLVDPAAPVKPLEIRFSDPKLNLEAFKTPYTADRKMLNAIDGERVLTLTQKLSSVTVTKRLQFKPNGTYDVSVTLSNPVEYYISPGFRPTEHADMYTFKGVLIRKAD